MLFHRVSGRPDQILSPAETLAQIEESVRLTSRNMGNLVHLEAPQKLFRHKPVAPDQRATDAAELDRRFDAIVLGYANMIRPREEKDNRDSRNIGARGRETALLAATRCEIVALGIGIQEALEPNPDVVDPSLFALLSTINRRASIFGVRGRETEAWLHAVGLTNARALGCPSLFVYPRNIMSIRSPATVVPSLRVATAGRLTRQDDNRRLEAVVRIGQRFQTSYVFQNDFFSTLQAADPQEVIYNDATGEVSPEQVKRRGVELGFNLPFNDYWMFRSTEKWRGFATGNEAFFGDRFHGGVVFMQVGKPAIIVQADARVRELTSFYDLPTATVDELLNNDPQDIMRERLSEAALRQMRETYAKRYRVFYDVVREAGLEFFNDIPPDEIDRMVD
ncbi:polysaccharide pyruvyl transferase family protein [Sphingomonas sp. IC-11]|uniref:polysaccharide pyruvyl transferase family protein n=1 Tax=Sphingomonas sp. IC-11 TaxID=2898528 RepID=UPI001E3E8648|nr:polysaccharide pyruvyl transferase family protein [Sphingomonas sp. IC-11]